MKYSIKKDLITGTAIPVSALRSEMSCGIGEFSDLKQFGDWCKETGLDLIQLLPVNDTGYQSSPYSALSAFALHPIYISIMEIPEAKKSSKDFDKIKKKWEAEHKVHFNDILKDKIKLLKEIYSENIGKIEKNKKIQSWEKQNTWIKNYSVFSFLKEKNKNKQWEDWTKFKDPTAKDIDKIYSENRDKTLFYSWVQYYLEEQLTKSSKYLEKLGINLKGDLPILMNVDSADVWEFRGIFNVSNRAGAPPDMFSNDGQNWGFPTYSWDSMEKDNYAWWKSRLKQAAKFYHAYRIDHVLGFFRIWTIPPKYNSGSMGYYGPSNFLTTEDLESIGISGDRLNWMTEPHLPGFELRSNIGLESNEAIKYFLNQIGDEDLYVFKPEIESVNDIKAVTAVSDEAKDKMIGFFQNIAIMEVEEGKYTTTWFYHNSRAFHSMSDSEKYDLSELLKQKSGWSEELWKNQGLKLLKFMKESEDMLVCAEDLGTIPDSVPAVLEELGILGLHVTRWSKKYYEYGEPYIKPSEYNYNSVSTPAVHDSSTVKQWWAEAAQSNEVSNALNHDWLGDQPTPENVTKMYEALLKTTSKIAMFQYQDLLAIDSDICREDMNSERINVPGTTNDENWSYRMDFTIEKLLENKTFTKKLNDLLTKRG